MTADLFSRPIDLFIFQSGVVIIGFYTTFSSRGDDQRSNLSNDLCQAGLIVLFFLTYAGVGPDSISYGQYFDQYLVYPITESIFFIKQVLFLGFGGLLTLFLHPPWPLKILSMIGVGFFLFGMFRFVRTVNSPAISLSLTFCLLTPGVVYLFANGVRQGIACALAFVGFYYLIHRRWLRAVSLTAVAIGVHISAGVAFITGGIFGFIPSRYLWLVLMLSPLCGFGVYVFFGIDGPGGVHLNYNDNTEGSLHLSRLAFSYILAVIALRCSTQMEQFQQSWLMRAYAGSVGIAGFFLMWEAPSSRLLLQSDLFLPGVAALILANYRDLWIDSNLLKILLVLGTILGGWMFLALPSTQITLFY